MNMDALPVEEAMQKGLELLAQSTTEIGQVLASIAQAQQQQGQQFLEAQQQNQQAFLQMMKMMQAPKRVVYDEQGRVQGVQPVDQGEGVP
jgi:flagellar biosynthesis/type III secretory pathway chaperone